MGDADPAKADLRDAVLRMRRPTAARVLRAASERAVVHLAGLHAIQRAQVVALHAPVEGDLDPRGLAPTLADRGVRVLIVEPGLDGIQVSAIGRAHLVRSDEPAGSLDEIDVAVVPGVAFDLDGGRLGADPDPWETVLARIDRDALRVGLAHTTQLVPRVPRGADDLLLDVVVTDRGVHHTGARTHPRDA